MEYVIGGMGNAPANVIEVGLGDVKEGAVFHYMWTGKPTAGQARVLDWLVDYSADFIVYFDSGKVHPAVMLLQLMMWSWIPSRRTVMPSCSSCLIRTKLVRLPR